MSASSLVKHVLTFAKTKFITGQRDRGIAVYSKTNVKIIILVELEVVATNRNFSYSCFLNKTPITASQ